MSPGRLPSTPTSAASKISRTRDSAALRLLDVNVLAMLRSFLLDGKEHLRQRRLLLPPLHGERMQSYSSLMAEIASAAIDRMPAGSRFALHPHMQSIALQVILRAVFGLEAGAQMDELAELLVE